MTESEERLERDGDDAASPADSSDDQLAENSPSKNGSPVTMPAKNTANQSGSGRNFLVGLLPYLIFSFAVAALCLLRYIQILIGKSSFSSAVQIRHLEPTIAFFKKTASAGSLPAWNPYCYLGMPQLPDCFPGNFYPLNVLFLLPSHELACIAFLVVHQVIAAIGVCVALLKLGLHSKGIRMLVATLYVAAGIGLCGDDNLALAAVLAWLPFAIFGMAKCLGLASSEEDAKPHPGSLIVINSIFLGLMLLAGGTIVVVGAILFFVCSLAARFVYVELKKPKFARQPAVALYLVSIALAVGIASPVLLPLFEWASGPTKFSSTASVKRIFENFLYSTPNCAKFTRVFTGPETIDRESRKALDKKSLAVMEAVKGFATHQGRYLVVLPREEVKPDLDSNVCRTLLPNHNMQHTVTSPLGYLGHPSNGYLDLVSTALNGDPRSGFGEVPNDPTSASLVLGLCRLTSTGIVVTYDWPSGLLSQSGFWDWRKSSPSFRELPETWHLYQQFVTTPIAYSSACWHWLKKPQDLFVEGISAKKIFDPRMKTLVEKPEQLDIDEEKLDMIPFSEDPIGGPPIGDSPNVAIDTTMTYIKPVEVLIYEPEHISLSVKVSAPSFIVNNASFYPGWKAYVDGVPVPSFRANGFARAVFVKEGSHLVAFDFRPDSLKLGTTISAFALGGLVLLTFYWLWGLLGKTVRLMAYGRFE